MKSSIRTFVLAAIAAASFAATTHSASRPTPLCPRYKRRLHNSVRGRYRHGQCGHCAVGRNVCPRRPANTLDCPLYRYDDRGVLHRESGGNPPAVWGVFHDHGSCRRSKLRHGPAQRVLHHHGVHAN
jgi:hypothetical protein